jgi:hypothetical protein
MLANMCDREDDYSDLERYVLIAQPDFEFLLAIFVLLRPSCIVFLHYFAVFDDSLDFRNHGLAVSFQ